MKTRVVCTKLTQSEYEGLVRAAAKRRITTSVFLRQALGIYLAVDIIPKTRFYRRIEDMAKGIFMGSVVKQLEREWEKGAGRIVARDLIQDIQPVLSFIVPKKRGRPKTVK